MHCMSLHVVRSLQRMALSDAALVLDVSGRESARQWNMGEGKEHSCRRDRAHFGFLGVKLYGRGRDERSCALEMFNRPALFREWPRVASTWLLASDGRGR